MLASFYGGIVEEILLRLFMVNLLVRLLMLVLRREKRNPGLFEIWTAIIVSSVIFALGHLATGTAVTEVSAMFGIRIMLLNSIAGVTFGYLFVRRGLLTAMTAHFTADIVIHVLTAL
jgi:membrane protease YdiL (CAAX protease family)